MRACSSLCFPYDHRHPRKASQKKSAKKHVRSGLQASTPTKPHLRPQPCTSRPSRPRAPSHRRHSDESAGLGTRHKVGSHAQGCRKTSETHTSRQLYTREMDGHKSPTQHQMMVVILVLYIPPARRPVYISPLHAQRIMAVLLCRMCDRIMASQEQNKIRAPFHATRDAEKCPTYMILIQPKPKIPTQRIPEKIKNANRPDPTRSEPS